MELGQRLKQTRLEAGLSQRQLCGDQLTRNMLSLIENGAAHPSMDTLLYLAGRLGKPVSFFLEEESVSPNQHRIAAARAAFSQGDPGAAMEILSAYEGPDPVFDAERHLLESFCLLSCVGSQPNAPLSAQIAAAAQQTPYFSKDLQWRWLLLQGDAAMDAGDPQTALHWYTLAQKQAPEQTWFRLEKCHEQLQDYKMAYHYACLQRK